MHTPNTVLVLCPPLTEQVHKCLKTQGTLCLTLSEQVHTCIKAVGGQIFLFIPSLSKCIPNPIFNIPTINDCTTACVSLQVLQNQLIDNFTLSCTLLWLHHCSIHFTLPPPAICLLHTVTIPWDFLLLL